MFDAIASGANLGVLLSLHIFYVCSSELNLWIIALSSSIAGLAIGAAVNRVIEIRSTLRVIKRSSGCEN